MVLDDVKQIVAAQMHLSPDNVKDTTTFYDLEADSLDVVEVIMALESKFDMILPDEAVEPSKPSAILRIISRISEVNL